MPILAQVQSTPNGASDCEYEFDCENRKTVKQNPASTNVNIDQQHTIHIADSNVVSA